jgi:NAD(P)-dependent dehydrogenase (short-subunit alcohol dehydrogenase family)
MSAEVRFPRRAVVTGAASGIGQATAILLRERGSEVVAVDMNEAGLAEAKDAGAETLAVDITEPAGRARLHEVAGEIDGLVNAAGILRIIPVPDITDDVWDSILNVNVKALFYLARDFGMKMPEGSGIVNLSSVAGKASASTDTLCYGASKAAVLSVTRSLAYYLGPRGVRVNAVLPGITDTPMQTKFLEQAAVVRGTTAEKLHEDRLKSVPLQNRQAPPNELADAITFLLSSAASYITGQALAVDGGLVMY